MRQLTSTIAIDVMRTEKAIKLVKDTFERELASALRLQRVSAPRFLPAGTGLQDDLTGWEEPVRFRTKAGEVEMVHSLAKWKRYALHKYGFTEGTGLYTDMDAVRKDEKLDATHSVYVDQWDWEKVIGREDRTLDSLKDVVRRIFKALKATEKELQGRFPGFAPRLPEDIAFVHAEDLEREYPDLSPKEREDAVAERHGAVFLIGIGHPLSSGEPHDDRAADYDDWVTPTGEGRHGLDGDILVWDGLRERALELSSMGIRVDAAAMRKQLAMKRQDDKASLRFHRGVLEDELPLTMGGGIGQSRTCMFLLHKRHVGEVQCGVWPAEMERECEEQGSFLL